MRLYSHTWLPREWAWAKNHPRILGQLVERMAEAYDNVTALTVDASNGITVEFSGGLPLDLGPLYGLADLTIHTAQIQERAESADLELFWSDEGCP
jgi:hypothetical protein